MNVIKRLAIAGATVSIALGAYAIPVFAAADASNTNITQDSFADVEASDNDSLKVDTKNLDTDFVNIDASLASSGLNDQSGNEDGNDLTTKEADAWYKTDNFLNVNEVSGHDGALASNSNISDNSDGDALAEDNDKVDVYNTNEDTLLFNLTASVANSGFNSQDNNEDGNNMLVGAADSFALTSNVVNHNLVSGGDGSSAEASNSNISNDSFADAEAYDNDQIKVSNVNKDTDVINVTAAVSNSGLNSQSGNEDGNDMTVGDSSSVSVASNYVNVNETKVGGSGATATNTNVSDNSDGDATAQDNDKIDVKNENKETTVVNVSASVSNSGDNTQSNNEDGNSMTTGSAEATGQTTNVVNANQVSW